MRWQDYLLLLLMMGAGIYYIIGQRRKPKKRPRGKNTNQLNRRELAALRKLQLKGFKLHEIHPEVPVTFTSEKKNKSFAWVGNFSVVKNGKVYLVKVIKEGSAFSSAAVRQELLTDHLMFQPTGLFVYSADSEQLQQLDIAYSGGDQGDSRQKLLVRLALIFLIIMGLALLYRLAIQGGSLI